MAENDEIIQMETQNSAVEGSRESLIQPNRHGIILKVSDLDLKPICRICYSGSSKERLIRPCKCKGTIEYVHRNCLERWLEAKNVEACELCHYHFETKRTRKGCWEWLKQPEMQTERRNFIGDFTCFAFLTPLGIATFWLCAEGAIYYQRVKASTLETVALITLAIFLVVAYFTWVSLCTRYHLLMWNRWRNHNWNVRIVDRMSVEEISNNASDLAIDISSSIMEASMLLWEQSATYASSTETITLMPIPNTHQELPSNDKAINNVEENVKVINNVGETNV